MATTLVVLRALCVAALLLSWTQGQNPSGVLPSPAPTFTPAPTSMPTSQWTKVLFKVVTGYPSSASCSGPFTVLNVTFLGLCISKQTGGATMSTATANNFGGGAVTTSTQTYSDVLCTTPSGALTTATDTLSAIPLSNPTRFSKCAPVGNGSYATAYTAKRPLLPNARGVLWTGYATPTDCIGAQRGVYLNYTAAGACLPFGTGSTAYSCDQFNVYSKTYSDGACSAQLGVQTTTSFVAIKAAGCAAVTAVGGYKMYMRAVCHFRAEGEVGGAMVPVPGSGLSSQVSQAIVGPGSAPAVNPFFITRVFYAGARCGGAHSPLFYRLDPAAINVCTVPSVGLPFQYQCKLGTKKLTVAKLTYADSDRACSLPPASQETYLHDADCARDDVSRFFRQSLCGGLPALASGASSLDSLLVREYSDPGCINDAASRGTVLGVCGPLYGPRRHGLPAVIEKRRRVTLVSATTARGIKTVTVTENLYAKEDSSCADTVVQATTITYRDGACQPDPLYPGVFVKHVAHNPAGSVMSPQNPPPAWFASIPGPTSAPTSVPTVAPTFTPTRGPTAAPTTPTVQRGLVMALDANTWSAGTGAWVDSVGGMAFGMYGSPLPQYSATNGGSIAFTPANGNYAGTTLGVAANTVSSLPVLTKWSLEVWHFYTGVTIGAGACIISDVFGSGSKINYFLGSNYTPLQTGYYTGSTHNTAGYTALAAGNWYHIVSTFDSILGTIYVNGVQVVQTNIAGTPQGDRAGIHIMRRWDATANLEFWGGSLGIVRIYNVDLNAVEVQTNYGAERARFGL